MFMKVHRLRTLLLAAAVFALVLALPAFPRAGAVVQAQDTCQPFVLNSEQEAAATPVMSSGVGLGTVTYNTDTNLLTWSVAYGGLTTPVANAHFHGPAGIGQNASPVVQQPGVGPGSTPPAPNPLTGTETLTEDQEFQLAAGLWYYNIHTSNYPQGEIRGQVRACITGDEAAIPYQAFFPVATHGGAADSGDDGGGETDQLP